MKHLLTLLAAFTLLVSPAAAQTIKSLGYNTTNGSIVANTGTNTLRFTNNVSFQGGPLINGSGIFYDTSGGINLEENILTDNSNSTVFTWGDSTVSFSKPITFANTTNAATTRTNLGLGATNTVRFGSILLYQDGEITNAITYAPDQLSFSQNSVTFFSLDGADAGMVLFEKPIYFLGTNAITNAARTQSTLFYTNTIPTNTTNVSAWISVLVGTNSYRVPVYK